MNIKTKLFAQSIYSKEDGLNFDKTELILNSKSVVISHGMIFEGLNFMQINKAVILLDSLEILDKNAREIFLEHIDEKSGIVDFFIELHYNEYGNEIRNRIYEKLDLKEQNNRAFLDNIELGNFHISEDDEPNSVRITMDYSLIWEDGCSFTDQLLVINFDEYGDYIFHTHES